MAKWPIENMVKLTYNYYGGIGMELFKRILLLIIIDSETVIEIKDLDEYKYFCIAQVLKQNKLESTYYKSGEVLRLMVFIDDELVLQKFLQDLQYYRIQYTLN